MRGLSVGRRDFGGTKLSRRKFYGVFPVWGAVCILSTSPQEFFSKNQVFVIPWVTVLRAEIPGQTYLSSYPNFTAY